MKDMRWRLSSLVLLLLLLLNDCIDKKHVVKAFVPLAQVVNNEMMRFQPFVVSSREASQKLQSSKSSLPTSSPLTTTTATEEEEESNDRELKEQCFNLTFGTYDELISKKKGEFVASEAFQVIGSNNQNYTFRLLIYPRGGGYFTKNHPSGNTLFNKQQKQNDWMSRLANAMDTSPERVGFYLQFLPQYPNQTQVDASFAIRCIGQQMGQPRFDLEWNAGIRFVSNNNNAADNQQTSSSSSPRNLLSKGCATDFGSHLMQTWLLENFLGADVEDHPKHNLKVQVRIKLHSTTPQQQQQSQQHDDEESIPKRIIQLLVSSLSLRDIRPLYNQTTGRPLFPHQHNPETVRTGNIIVPIFQNLKQRQKLFAIGAYPGVEYRIMNIYNNDNDDNDNAIFYSRPDAIYEIRPIYPLVKALERPWPVKVKEKDMPLLFTADMYTATSALGSLVLAFSGLLGALIFSRIIASLFYIPSQSMEPTLLKGDVVLVEKVTPALDKLFYNNNNNNMNSPLTKPGQMILFHPSQQLQQLINTNGKQQISNADLFVKRVAAGPGQIVSVDAKGHVQFSNDDNDNKVSLATDRRRRDYCGTEPLGLIQRYIRPGQTTVGPNQVFVLGDCESVSVDSRVWGPLDLDNIVGKPLWRIWPLNRMGPVDRAAAIDDLTLGETEWK